ncbi:MAG: LamG domain-containing protein [Candidatus Moraniibacteriota bacterium]|nr:MAG: LamG domain-containing protein [Candidatus Moranbacteria bacterium]
MRISLLRATQWFFIALFVAGTVGLTYDFNSEASKTVNAPIENRLSQGILGYWKLDDGSGTNATDSSGNGNTLAMTGSPSWTTGQIGAYSLDFSGSGQYLSIADPASGILDFVDGADFTIVGWFNRDTFAADHTIVAKKTDQTTNAGYVVWVDNNAGNDYLNFEISDGTDTYSATGATNLSATGWHHFAAVWNDNTGMYLYLDGSLDGSTTTSTAAINSLANANAFRIGAESDAGVPFDGKIDDVRLYGKALSEDAVKRLYQTTVPGDPVDTGLVGHWTFDGPDVIWGDTSNEIKDVSGKGNHGDAVGLTASSAVIGKLGQALSFDGTGIDVADSTSLDITTGEISMSAWVSLDSFPASSQYVLIFGKPNNYFLYLYNAGSDNLDVDFGFASTGPTYRDELTTTQPIVNTNEWYHIVATYKDSSNTIVMYVNGVPQTDNGGASAYTPITDNLPLNMGEAYDSYSFYGKIDDVRLYNRTLSATEVVELYNRGK